jgi:vitamin B12 transport system substrate-binding protein
MNIVQLPSLKTHCLFLLIILLIGFSYANTNLNEIESPKRIISLAPHLTELAYALKVGDRLVAVSDYSDYPEQASRLPSVASFQGVDFEAIVRLKPDLILAWQGGNKPQDLARLTSLGFTLFYSNPKKLSDISTEVRALGDALNQTEIGEQLATNFDVTLGAIKAEYQSEVQIPVLYYLWPKPLMTIGQSAWGNELLSVCGARNIFDDAINDYPEVPIESVVRRKPRVIVAVNKESQQQITHFWRPWLPLLERSERHLKQANPDLLHRFTPRLLTGLSELCKHIHLPLEND